ncbi:MAG: response regulator [Lachnospiraceae bacterium]|nr:response regulator [Lachnospiraceae bacterium]
MQTILIVDDVEINRKILASFFEEQYNILEAADGEEAIRIINEKKKEISLIFLDLIMPNKNGIDVLIYLRGVGLLDCIPVIMITGEATEETDMKAYKYGAADVIYKPFTEKIVTKRAMNLMEQFSIREKKETEMRLQTSEVFESMEQLASMNEFLLDALGSVAEFGSLESASHIKRIKSFTKILLGYVKSDYPEYGLSDRKIYLISQASALHDIGKIAMPDEILNAPRKLTVDEFDEIKKHATVGCEIILQFQLADNEFFKYCYDICRWHHEKIDGKGYPDGLVGNEIPVYCEAVAVADCFDSLVRKRVYQDAVSCPEAFDMIRKGECGAFSEVVMNCFKKAKTEFFRVVETENRT